MSATVLQFPSSQEQIDKARGSVDLVCDMALSALIGAVGGLREELDSDWLAARYAAIVASFREIDTALSKL